jgi:uncharacterized protein with von Willebrand factor type A (vWA) domain
MCYGVRTSWSLLDPPLYNIHFKIIIHYKIAIPYYTNSLGYIKSQQLVNNNNNTCDFIYISLSCDYLIWMSPEPKHAWDVHFTQSLAFYILLEIILEIKFIKMTKATIVIFFYRSYQVLLTDVVIIPRWAIQAPGSL